MVDAPLELYRAAFAARQGHGLGACSAPLSAPGLDGVVCTEGPRVLRVLVTDDRGHDVLASEVAAAQQGFANVFERAARSDELLRGLPEWAADRPSTAMVLREIDPGSGSALPDGLDVRPVAVRGNGAPGAVALEDAAAVAIASDPGIAEPAAEFAAYLRGLPSSVQLFAAVGEDGVAHATSGCDVHGEHARIFFVDTEPTWRRRGIGSAMTAAALRAAAAAGARHAYLHATTDGASVYMRLGFEAIGRLTRYSRRPRACRSTGEHPWP